MVGCLLLQSLQTTAVSGEEVSDQTIKDEAFKEYVMSEGEKRKKVKTTCSCITMYAIVGHSKFAFFTG